MSNSVYGGEDVGALVFDMGHHSLRAGYAGEECPRAEIPSTVGYMQETGDGNDENKPPAGGDASSSGKGKKYFIDTQSMSVPRAGMELDTFLQQSLIEDWDMFEAVMDHTYKRHLMCDPENSPVLISEAAQNTVKARREQLCELMFERFGVPAYYASKQPVLAAFAAARATALVVDSGATHTTATPVYDGYVLTNAIFRSPLGSDCITRACEEMLSKQHNIAIIPPYMVASKTPVGDREPPTWTQRPNLPEVTTSYHKYMVNQVIKDFQHSVLQISDTPYNEEVADKLPAYHYEFPNGFHQDFIAERMRIPELLFDPAIADAGAPGTVSHHPLGVARLVLEAIQRCDVDMRASLFSGIVLTGGNSLIQGFSERLQAELSSRLPANCRLKLHAPASSAERRFGAWIGGSILASLGSFQQMWISKQEYDETGKGIVEQKCP